MTLHVKHAVFGAQANAFNVTSKLQALLEQGNGVATINDSNFGDPAVGSPKHFGAVVSRDGSDFYFACNEGQAIDFKVGGGTLPSPNSFAVQFATYGALQGGIGSKAEAFDVTAILQEQVNHSRSVKISNDIFGDPSPGNQKHFAAAVLHAGRITPFACLEGETLDFTVASSNQIS